MKARIASPANTMVHLIPQSEVFSWPLRLIDLAPVPGLCSGLLILALCQLLINTSYFSAAVALLTSVLFLFQDQNNGGGLKLLSCRLTSC